MKSCAKGIPLGEVVPKASRWEKIINLLVFILIIGILGRESCFAQELKLKSRKADALGGRAFAQSIIDSSLTLEERENIIFKEIKSGNVPGFLRKLKEVKQTSIRNADTLTVSFYVLPDYFCIGGDTDFFYVPMTPILAQRVAELTKSSLPTKKMVDMIYLNATIKLQPKPIPPTKAMITVPIFLAHSDSVNIQLLPYRLEHLHGALTAGNKKDIIISNKIYTEKTSKVVIYGWHKIDGKAIQPVYNKHTNLWADYSHGIRLVQQKIYINGKKTTLKKTLQSEIYSSILSDEGMIEKPFYPITGYQLSN